MCQGQLFNNLINCVLFILELQKNFKFLGLAHFDPVIVDLSRNPLKSISRFPKLPIQMLNLSSCYIHHFETSALTALEELTTLDLSYNRISASDLKDLSVSVYFLLNSTRCSQFSYFFLIQYIVTWGYLVKGAENY